MSRLGARWILAGLAGLVTTGGPTREPPVPRPRYLREGARRPAASQVEVHP
jgi:hypothetical protein